MDLPIVNFGTQWGAQAAFGTEVAADKVLSTLGLSRFAPMGSGTPFIAQGNKVNTAMVPVGRERCEANLAGVMDYGELIYPFCAGIKNVAPTADGTNGKKWLFRYAKSGADVKKSFTIESGDAVHAQKAASFELTDLTLDMSWETTQVTGKLVGQNLQDDIALTGAPTTLATNLLNPGTFSVKTAASLAGLAGASEYGRPFNAQLNIPGISQPLNRMNPTDTSHVAMIENALGGMTFKLTTGADTADMALLTNWRAGTTFFVQVSNTGAVIAGAVPSAYAFNLIVCCQVPNAYTPTEVQGVAGAEWSFGIQHDPTAGYGLEIYLINTFAAL